MNLPSLSIIICTFNREKLLKLCLDSCLSQQDCDMGRYEIIVIDNNSKDGTKELVTHYSRTYPNVRYVFEANQGLSHARNRGFHEAHAEYLAYLDDDAMAPPQYLATVLNVLDNHAPDIMGGPVYPYYLDKKPRWFRDKFEKREHAEKSGFSRACRVSGGNFIIRKETLLEMGMFDVTLGMMGDKVGMGEERAVLEAYRRNIKKGEQKVYYSLDCYVNHYVPPFKMTISYLLTRGYRSGRAVAKLKKKEPATVFARIRELFPNFMNALRGEIKDHGFSNADYMSILVDSMVRIGNIVELLSHGPRAVLRPHVTKISRRH